MVCEGSTGALGLAHRPVLLKSHSTNNRGLVGAGALVNVICCPATHDGALPCSSAGGVVLGTEVLDGVVLDKRVPGLSIDGKVTVAIGAIGTRVAGDPRAQIGAISLFSRCKREVHI